MTDLTDILNRIGRLETDMSEVKTNVSAIKERLTHMPTTVSMGLTAGTAVAVVVAALWAIFSFLGPGMMDTAVRASMQDITESAPQSAAPAANDQAPKL